MPVTVAMGNAYYVFFVPMVIATRMPMPIVTGMPVTMCTGTSTIGKHAPWAHRGHPEPPTGAFWGPNEPFLPVFSSWVVPYGLKQC